MGGGDSQTTNTNQSQNQTYNQLQSLIENLATSGQSTNNTTQNQTQNVSGTTTSNTNTNQATTGATTNNQNTTGSTTGATTGATTGQVNPYAPTVTSIQNLIKSLQGMSTQLTPAQQQALGNLQAAAGGIPNVGPNATAAVNNLYNSTNGIPEAGIWGGAYDQAQRALSPYLDPNYTSSQNANIQTMLNGPNGINETIMGDVNGEFAAAGRDPVGNADAAKAAARAMTNADAGIYMGEQNTLAQQQQAAEAALFGQGGATATGMTNALQTPLMNEIAAMQASGNLPGLWTQGANAEVGAANQAYASPFQNIGTMQALIAQLAGLGQSSSGTSMGTSMGTTDQSTAGGTTSQQDTTGTSSTTGTNNQTATGTGTTSSVGTTANQTAGSTTGATSGASQGNMSGTSTTQQDPNMFNTMAGLGLGLLSLMPSDERLKENIEPVGLLNNGINVYKYNYRGDTRPQIGVMAQEVEKVKPEAVVDVPVGGLWGSVKMVDYEQAVA